MRWRRHAQRRRDPGRARGLRKLRRRDELPPFESAPALPQLVAARERKLRRTHELAEAGELETAIKAFLDADAINGELGVGAAW